MDLSDVQFNCRTVFWNGFQIAEYHSAKRCVVRRFRKIYVQYPGEVIHISRASDSPEIFLDLFNFRRLILVKFVINISKDLFHQVLQCDDTGCVPVLIYYHGDMKFLFLHISEESRCMNSLWNEIGWLEQGSNVRAMPFCPGEKECTGIEDTKNVMQIFPVYRIPGKSGFRDELGDLLIGSINRNRDDFRFVSHTVADNRIIKFQHILNPFFFITVDGTILLTELDHETDFFFGHSFLFSLSFHTEQFQYHVCGEGEESNRRFHNQSYE